MSLVGIVILGYWIEQTNDIAKNKYGIDAGEAKKPLATNFGQMLSLF